MGINKKLTRRQILQAGVAANLWLSGCGSQDDWASSDESIKFGLITDVQYADADPSRERIYRGSPAKLETAVKHLNTLGLDFVIHLGDLIDHDYLSFHRVLPLMKRLNAPVAYVLGNHDFDVDDSFKDGVPGQLGMASRYYDFVMGQWRFIVLDGNDISLHAYVQDSPKYKEASAYLEQLKSLGKTYAKEWNGAVGYEQLGWLRSRLMLATQARQHVIVFCHWPVFPAELDTLWNPDEVTEVLESFDCVKAYMGGHHHVGGYGIKQGIHYVTFKAMLDGEARTSYSMVNCQSDKIEITGYGDEPSRVLA